MQPRVWIERMPLPLTPPEKEEKTPSVIIIDMGGDPEPEETGITVLAPPEDFEVPTFKGAEHWKRLFREWGLPNTAPRSGESPFGRSRVLFVDDFDDGRPVAYWVPDED